MVQYTFPTSLRIFIYDWYVLTKSARNVQKRNPLRLLSIGKLKDAVLNTKPHTLEEAKRNNHQEIGGIIQHKLD